ELTEALAEAGIGTYESPGATKPDVEVTAPGPVKLLRDQVAVFSLESRDATGTTGAQLDSVAAAPAEGVPFSLVVAAYVGAGDTEGARLSRRLMGEQLWAQSADLVFPDVVLSLFANDAARESLAQQPKGARSFGVAKTASASVGAPVEGATGVCSQLAGWVDGIIQTVTDALKVDTSDGGVTGFFGDIWNAVVDLGVAAGSAAIGALTAPVVGIIKTGLAVAGTLSMVAGLLRPWSVSAEQQPDPVAYGIEPAGGNDAKVVATVDVGESEPFSAGVIDCAQQAGVKLPDPKSAKGSKIDWTPVGIDAVGTDISEDGLVGADDTASLRFTTRTESKEAATEGDAVPHTIAVTIEVERTQIDDLQALLQTILTGSLPTGVGDLAGAIFGVITQPIFDELASMLGTANAAMGTVISHQEPEKKPTTTTTTPEDECEGLAEGVIPDGTWTGPIEVGVDGSSSDASGSIKSTGSGTMTMTVANGKVTGGTWSLTISSSGTLQTDGSTATINSMNGSIQGTVDGPASAPHQSGQFTLNGSISVSVQGFNTEVPIDENGGTEATLTVEQSSCSAVSGTFIPSFNSATGGQAYFEGVARWSGEAA
ncbi:MAG: hypothetical protein ACTHN0_19615, partial [Aquihabitans sp.]